MTIVARLFDAEILWREGRKEGALLLALAAVAAASRLRYPTVRDRDAFEQFLTDASRVRLSVEFRGALHPIEHVMYKWLRCELVHEGGLPIDIQLVADSESSTRFIRAGGAPEFVLHLSESWFSFLTEAVRNAPELLNLPAAM